MNNTLGWGLVAALLFEAGCGSDNNDGSTGGGGRADAGTGGTVTIRSGGAGGGGNAGHGGGGAAGIGAGGGAGAGAGGVGGYGSGGSVLVDAGAGGIGGSDGGAGNDDGDTRIPDVGDAWTVWPPPHSVPPALEVPAGATVKILDRGVGAQIYTCTASGAVDAGVDGGTTTYACVLHGGWKRGQRCHRSPLPSRGCSCARLPPVAQGCSATSPTCSE